ncbi:MAG TPA: NYN domain-containing protein [Vicinamibacterales bacterium]|nr:NYN domain-containing protein [Vicinamibacterales bacterium]
MADARLKIAVFIDFDNIEIGVKSTLGVQFDIGVVLEALKERGDVVSKIAYGDWTRAGDYSRSLTQHATKLVQRNLTPGGDKNGADINLALDALEMAFTHSHINAYVIVGGDSDFITLVEKLKQYDKQIFVVGGRAFTSMVMQRNCHEFIAYENLVGSRRSQEKGRASAPVTQAPVDQVVPLVRRALKVLTDREVSPQLGLLKSTLLQLDSTFSERTYGAGSFRDFAQKLAAAGHVTLRESGRNVLVELPDTAPVAEASGSRERRHAREAHPRSHDRTDPRAAETEARESPPTGEDGGPRLADGIREVRRLFQAAQNPPRWPMYVRQARQFLRGVDPAFDERRFGFASLVDLMRACQRDGAFRIERDRQGVMRIFPGNVMQSSTGAQVIDTDEDSRGNVAELQPGFAQGAAGPDPGTATSDPEPDVVEGDVVQEFELAPPVIDVDETSATQETSQRQPRGARSRATGTARARRSAEAPAAPRARRAPGKPRQPRSRVRAKDTSS